MPEPARKPKLTSLINEIRKQYGENAITTAAEMPRMPTISTNVFPLDVALGGGLPMGRVNIFVGEPQGGKSTLSQFVVANAQRTDRNTWKPLVRTPEGAYVDPETGEVGEPLVAVWIDAEFTFDPDWARACGVDMEALLVVKPKHAESVYDVAVAMIRSGEADVIVVDSIAAMSPDDEMERSTEDQLVGLGARINNKGFRKMVGEFNRLVQSGARPFAPMVIMINQLREKVGVMYGSPETVPGGRGQEFFAGLRIKVWPESLGKALKNDHDEIVARTSKFKVDKNKVNGAMAEGEFTIFLRAHEGYRAGQVVEFEQVLGLAERYGLLEKKGSWITLPDGERVQGTAKAAEYYVEHPEDYAALKAQIIMAAKGRGDEA